MFEGARGLGFFRLWVKGWRALAGVGSYLGGVPVP